MNQTGDEHFTGKDLTFSIERDNSDIRYFLTRFRRRAKVVSKTVEMVDLCLRLYHHLHDTPRNFAALSAIFPIHLYLGISRKAYST